MAGNLFDITMVMKVLNSIIPVKMPITIISMRLRVYCISSVVALLGIIVQLGCNSVPTQPGTLAEYQIRATLIQDPNIDSSRIVIKLLRDGNDYPGATLEFGSSVLNFSNLKYGFDSIYYFSQDMTPGYPAGARNLVLDDSPFFTDTIVITVEGAFDIDTINSPATKILRPGETVAYTWSGSANAQNYVMAAFLADSVYRGYGYSEYLPNVGTSGTLPVEAFSQAPGPDMDTGLYNIYVYAITGVPDSVLTARLLPVPLPLQFPNNISTADLVGRVGSIQVTLLDTVRAQTIP